MLGFNWAGATDIIARNGRTVLWNTGPGTSFKNACLAHCRLQFAAEQLERVGQKVARQACSHLESVAALSLCACRSMRGPEDLLKPVLASRESVASSS